MSRPTKTKHFLAQAAQYRQRAVDETPFDYPKDQVVHWRHGKHLRMATVVGHNPYAPQVQVQSRSGARIWIEVERLLDSFSVTRRDE